MRLPLTLVSATLLALAVPAHAQDASTGDDGSRFTLSGTQLVSEHDGRARVSLELGCNGIALRVHRARVFVACGRDGLVVVDVASAATPVLVERRQVEGEAVGLFVLDDRVWVQLTRTEARPIDETSRAVAPLEPPIPPPPPAAPIEPLGTPTPTTPSPSMLGRVTDVALGEALVVFDGGHGLTPGAHVELFTRESTSLGTDETAQHERRHAIGIVTLTTLDRARVELGIAERVPIGAFARSSSLPVTATRDAPPRLDGLWRIEAIARPFLALETLGIGSVNELSITRRFEAPFFVRLELSPVVIGLADDGNVFNYAALALAGYDQTYFEIGLGVGALSFRDTSYRYDPMTMRSELIDNSGAAFAVAQTIRLGPADGWNLVVDNAFALVDDGFEHAQTSATAQIPIFERSFLLLRGGGGATGFAFGEVGLRQLVRGNGDAGSLFIDVTVGGGTIWMVTRECDDAGACTSDETQYAGPMLGFGVDWRP